ncbi:MAG: ribosome small subunit-dependent GTPase A [Spirochaetes bacterium]|nr:ribosome small subunit-dependent GTPase A [Spirochaetota bacterium]
MRGLVVSGSNNHFLVDPGSGSLVRCGIKGKQLAALQGWYNSLAPGDMVEFEEDAHDPAKGLVSALVPRRNVFRRFNEKGKSDQAIAANLDAIACVTSPAMPPFRPRFIDRVSIVAERDGIPLLIVMNKADLGIDDAVRARLVGYGRIGYKVMECSVVTGEGIGELRGAIFGKTIAFVGQSGVGKSSLLNLIEDGLARRVGEVSQKYRRGRHTTTGSALAALADGVTKVVDTPGFRRLAIRGIGPESLASCFPEMRPLVGACPFGYRCRHLDENGCAVTAAVEDKAIDGDRYESYVRVRAELEETVEYARKRGRPLRIYDDHE